MAKWFKFLEMGLLAALLLPCTAWAQDSPVDEPQDEVDDVIVVTASRTEQRLQEVPVAMSVISARELETKPVDDFGDVLRSVPGVNVAQISARDVQVNTRGSTNSLSNSQLVLLDGRTVYLDFFGFVMWDLLPIDMREIAQIEVVRGPGSAVWGANALGGVVNMITKSPWEMVGTSVVLGVGDLDTLYGTVTHARAGDNWGLKASASYYEQEPFDRPSGLIPGTSTPYPPFENEGTEQPKFDLRYDRNVRDDQILSLSGGLANTDGIVHSGIGPFDVDKETEFKYVKGSWSKLALQVNGFANIVDGLANNLLTRGLDGRPLEFQFESDTYNLDFSNSHSLNNHTITYGATLRQLDFFLSIAPGEDSRDEVGVFIQDEIQIGERWKWLVGARWDDIDPVGSNVSPRTSLMYSPSPDHNFRISYNEAFRAPSLVENFLNVTIVNAVDLSSIGLGQFIFPSRAVGNPLLKEESLEAFEVGYVGNFDDITFTAAIYRNELKDATDFFPASAYTPANPPPDWPLPAFFLAAPPFAGALPSSFTYRNIGERTEEGIELSLDYRPNSDWHFNVNYSYQAEPDLVGQSLDETNIAPENRFNIGLAYNGPRWFFDVGANYVDEAFWTDVLDSRFWGPTDSYTMLNASVGIRLAGDKVTLSIIGTNVTDEFVQQHIFGDIISRKITGQVRFVF
ncbi:MAG: TonB-dependent receptor [Thermoanaerobaculia bacterium]|nr:TonB-dependent receptor [Thermoanaerobaculia bacterium]